MGLYLLDTDAVIDYLVGFAPSVDLIRSIHTSGNDLGVCDVVVAEVYSGLRPEDRERTAALLEALQLLTTAADASHRAGEWRYSYARRGMTLATSDVLVAAAALAHGANLVTGNAASYPMAEVEVVPLPRRRS